MNCLRCSEEIPDSFFLTLGQTTAAERGRFTCPSCGAEHVRRSIGPTPDGKPQYSVRLWGHPTTAKRRKKKENGDHR